MQELRKKIYIIIFEHDTKAGKAFDLILILMVLLSVFAVMMETVNSVFSLNKDFFFALEWFFTLAFTLELALRLYATDEKTKYLKSFYGIVDVLSILPTYLAAMIPGAQAFLIIRVLRLLRVFRILKLSNYTSAGSNLREALLMAKPKIVVFLIFVMSLVSIIGTLMYYIEGGQSGFTSIPKSIYWAIVTMTTVGYGDIAPTTPLGQTLSAILMITGYGVIAVPTGIISTEMAKLENPNAKKTCPSCDSNKSLGANFCPACGKALTQTL